MASRVKKKDHEKLDDASIDRVAQLLEADKPITKKAACEMLNISYNTARLAKIIEAYRSDLEFQSTRRKLLKGKPFDTAEIRYTILNYLKGDAMAVLAKSQYRTVQGVKRVLEKYRIPVRDTSHDYWNPTFIPDEAVSETFEDNELVWSARYNCVAIITKLFTCDSTHGNVYGIWVFGKNNESALQPAYELGKLEVLKTLGVTDTDFEEVSTEGLFHSLR